MKPRKLLVVDCEGSRIRMLLCVRQWRKYQPLRQFVKTWKNDLREVLAEGCQYLKINKLGVVTALPDSHAIVKLFPAFNEEDDQEVWLRLRQQAKTIFQYEEKMLQMDFERLSQIRAVAAQREFVEEYLQPFKKQKLNIKMLTLRQLALECACRNLMINKKIVGIVEIRSSSVFFAVFLEGNFYYLREELLEGSLSFDNINEKIQQHYRFYLSSTSEQLISEILLCGYYHSIDNLCKTLTEQLELPVRVVGEFLVAIGLAISYGEACGY